MASSAVVLALFLVLAISSAQAQVGESTFPWCKCPTAAYACENSPYLAQQTSTIIGDTVQICFLFSYVGCGGIAAEYANCCALLSQNTYKVSINVGLPCIADPRPLVTLNGNPKSVSYDTYSTGAAIRVSNLNFNAGNIDGAKLCVTSNSVCPTPQSFCVSATGTCLLNYLDSTANKCCPNCLAGSTPAVYLPPPSPPPPTPPTCPRAQDISPPCRFDTINGGFVQSISNTFLLNSSAHPGASITATLTLSTTKSYKFTLTFTFTNYPLISSTHVQYNWFESNLQPTYGYTPFIDGTSTWAVNPKNCQGSYGPNATSYFVAGSSTSVYGYSSSSVSTVSVTGLNAASGGTITISAPFIDSSFGVWGSGVNPSSICCHQDSKGSGTVLAFRIYDTTKPSDGDDDGCPGEILSISTGNLKGEFDCTCPGEAPPPPKNIGRRLAL